MVVVRPVLALSSAVKPHAVLTCVKPHDICYVSLDRNSVSLLTCCLRLNESWLSV